MPLQKLSGFEKCTPPNKANVLYIAAHFGQSNEHRVEAGARARHLAGAGPTAGESYFGKFNSEPGAT
jgi:hypothetical protein